MSQSTSIHDLPKDNLRNPEEARIVQSMLHDNVEEMQNPALMGPPPGAYMQDPNSGVDMMPDFQQPRMPPGAMGGAQPMMQQPMPQMVPQIPMEQQMQFEQQQYQQQQKQQQAAIAAMSAAAQEVGIPQKFVEDQAWSTWLWNESKEPIIVIAIYFVISMAFVKHILAAYVPYLSNSFLNLLFRAVLMGILVYVAKKFV